MSSLLPRHPRLSWFHRTSTIGWHLGFAMVLAGLVAGSATGQSAKKEAPAADGDDAPPEPIELRLQTSDGVTLGVQYFAVAQAAKPLATVILVHELGSLSNALEPLAKTLQQTGCAVLVPDLRGHGQSSMAAYAKAAADGNQSKLLKASDFRAMAETRGGRIRGQSDLRGDIEAVHQWIRQQADNGKLSHDELIVVGSGLGAAVAATWTAADAAWAPIASGPQGGNVRALVLIDPAFSTKGFTIGPALSAESIKKQIPIMIVAGSASRDAGKVFDQLKRARPTSWFDSRLYDPAERRNTSPAKDSDASLLYVQVDARDKNGSPLGGDQLAALVASSPQQRTPAALTAVFVKAMAERPR